MPARTLLLERCHRSGYVFGVGKEGNPPTAAAISVAFARLASGLGLKGVSHHNSVTPRDRDGARRHLDVEFARAVRVTAEHADAAKEAPTNARTAAKNATDGSV